MSEAALDPSQQAAIRRYWIVVGALIAVLVVASLVVVLMGGSAALRARSLIPAPDSAVSSRPDIEIRFARGLDRGSVEGAVRLEPEMPFELNWADATTLRLLPLRPLEAGATYRVVVGPGVSDARGEPLEGELSWQFTVRQPRIASLRLNDAQQSELWLTTLDGAETRQISGPGQNVLDYDVAASGDTIVYTVEEGEGAIQLWIAELDRGALRRLTQEPGTLFGSPRLSPSAELVAVEARRVISIAEQGEQLAPPDLELIRPTNGSSAGLIYGDGPAVGHSPRWSPDGTRIAFVEATAQALAIFNFTSDVALFPSESVALGSQPWSWDSRALVHTTVLASEGRAQQVVVIRDLQMGTEILLGEAVGDQGEPAWSPDGTLIAYAFRPPPGAPIGNGIWSMRADGSGRALLAGDPDGLFAEPLWSADGQWLLYTRFDPTSTQSAQEIWAMRRNGADPRLIASGALSPRWIP